MAAQQPDRIVLDGETLQLYSNPLEEYWSQTKKRRPDFVTHPYCERGYIATWEIRNKHLYLIDIEGNFLHRSFLSGKKKLRFTMQTLFPDYDGKGIRAHWVTGKLRIPSGNMRWYAHQGYDSRFEKEVLISIENGTVTKKVILDFTSHTLQFADTN